MAQALVPLKDLVEAKTRLAGLLSSSERVALVRAMAEDVLAVLSRHPDLERVVVVSDDPDVRLLAHNYTVECWSERELGVRGLNALVAEASKRLLAGGANPLLVLHADLPLLGAADISAVLEAHERCSGLVVGCDRLGTGTNLLAFADGEAPQFCFGVDSCAGHVASARGAGVPVKIMRRFGIALDVDTAGDLAALVEAVPGLHGAMTRDLLGGGAMAERIQLALSSMEAVGAQAQEGKAK